MSIMPGTPQETEAGASIAPVILPMGLARSASGKVLVDRRPCGQGRQTEMSAPPAMAVESFAFPAILPKSAEPVASRPPGAIWPKCDCIEALQAGTKLAEAIGRRLSPSHPSVVAVTSPGDGDGKTGLVTVLAPELAKRTPGGVLAVDADFRKADLTSLLALAASRTPGRSPLIYPTDLPGLSVLPRPPGVESHYLDVAWVSRIRESWPLVLLDLASLEHAETVSLLRHCDGICLVVRLGHTARRAVVEAGRVISTSGGRLWGTVIVG